jgi:lipid A ethanolaminephosphotransferase
MPSIDPVKSPLVRAIAHLRNILRGEISTTKFVLIFSLANLAIYHQPLLSYTLSNLDPWSFNGITTILVVAILLLSLTVFMMMLLFMLARPIGLLASTLILIGNSLALYFISSYQVILDMSMMGNVLNTRYSEASEFFESGLLVSIVLFGLIPCWLLWQPKIKPTGRIRLLVQAVAALALGIGSFAAASNTWLWIDEHSKQLGGVMLPWSYVINGGKQLQEAMKKGVEDQTLLPPATSAGNDKTLVVLVIGETARAANYAFYGYHRQTNPAAEAAGMLALRNTRSCSTYTTASLNCILSHDNQSGIFSDDFERLPTYLQRHGIDVLWRSKNWGEPPIKVASYKTAGDLRDDCAVNCKYDEVLLTGLDEEIHASDKDRIFVVLHIKGSHGPKYNKRYPGEFEVFKPVCASVELQDCDQQSLVNAFDNTILYTDYFLGRVVELLRQFDDRSTALMYLSDHGESLGESGLYLHGAPYAIAPDVQKDIPFLVWTSEDFLRRQNMTNKQLLSQQYHSHSNVFHSVMGAFDLTSDVYREGLDIFSPEFDDRDS